MTYEVRVDGQTLHWNTNRDDALEFARTWAMTFPDRTVKVFETKKVASITCRVVKTVDETYEL